MTKLERFYNDQPESGEDCHSSHTACLLLCLPQAHGNEKGRETQDKSSKTLVTWPSIAFTIKIQMQHVCLHFIPVGPISYLYIHICVHTHTHTSVQTLPSLLQLDLRFFDFTMVWKPCTFNGNYTSNVKFFIFSRVNWCLICYFLAMPDNDREPELPVSHAIKRLNSQYYTVDCVTSILGILCFVFSNPFMSTKCHFRRLFSV